jgi:hypothetical protein
VVGENVDLDAGVLQGTKKTLLPTGRSRRERG